MEQMTTQANPTAPQTPNNAEKSPKKTPYRKLLCISSAVLIGTIGAGIGALSFGAGQRALIQLADKLLTPLAIEQVSGDLKNGLELRNVRWQSNGVDAQVAQVRLQTDLACLFKRNICVQDFTINQPKIYIDTAQLLPSEPKADEPSAPMEKIQLPISFNLNHFALNDLELNIDQTQLKLAQFHSALSLNNAQGLTFAPTEINELTLQTQAETSKNSPALSDEKSQAKTEILKTNTALSDEKNIDWNSIEQRLTPALLGELREVNLPFDLHIPSISGRNWRYQTVENAQVLEIFAISTAVLRADATGQNIELTQFDVQSSQGTLTAQGKAQLNGDFPLNAQLNADLKAFKRGAKTLLPASKIDLKITGALKQKTEIALQTQGALDAQLNGNVQLAQPKTPFDLTLNVKQGAYQFADSLNALKIHNVNLKVSGDLLNYQAQLSGNVEGMDYVPATQLSANVDGKLYQLNIHQLSLAALGGKAQLSGLVDWQNGAKWDVLADLDKMNIRPYVPAMPAILSGKLASSGEANAAHWRVEVPTLDLTGTLNNRALAANGKLSLSDERLLNVPEFTLNYGENRLTAQGELSEKSDFQFNINAPNLRGLWQDLSGSLIGSGQLSGKLNAPKLQAELNAKALHFADFNLANANLLADLQSEPQIRGKLNLKGDGVRVGESVNIRNLELTANGDEQNHQLILRSQGEPVAANLQINGKFDRPSNRWQGNLSGVNIDTKWLGALQPNQAISITFDGAQSAQIAAHCWRSRDVDLCFPQAFNVGQNGDVPFEIKRVNLELVNRLIEQEMLQGQLRSAGRVAWFRDKPLQLNVSVDGNNLSVAQKLDYRTFKLNIPTLALNADIQNNNLTLKSDLNVQNQGRIAADLKINDLPKSRNLGGSLAIERLNLAIANQLFSANERLDGEIVAHLDVGGNLAKPLLNGNFAIHNVKSKLNLVPFEIRDGDISLAFHGASSTLNGKIQTPDSQLNLSGSASWASLENWTAEIRAQADKFKVDVPNMAKLSISPNVVAKATPKLLDLSGNVVIPWARIAIESLPDNAETVSDDEVILNGPRKSKPELINRQFAAKTKSGMEIRSDLKIQIGDDVSLNAYGFKTKLHGLLAVKQEKGNLGLYGQIDLKDGRYASFGQDLLVRKGQISFSGLPSQPMLNIVAVRNPEAMEDSSVSAGVKVIGVATNPEVTVFSEPSKSQADALSYLLTGRSLESSGEAGSSGSVGAALLGLGLAKSGKLVGGIGEAFGIQDLNLGTAGVGDKSKVQVSGNIGKRLQVKYGVGLFDGLAEITLRYRLMPQLYFQSVSGANQVFDLLYQFEF